MLAQFREDLKKEEGFKSFLYRCPTGHLTIGYGTNIENGITEKQAAALMDIKLEEIAQGLFAIILTWDQLSEVRQAVLMDMAYQMGLGGVKQFHRMRDALDRLDFDRAADEMLDSSYGRDSWSTKRAHKNAERMRTDKWSD